MISVENAKNVLESFNGPVLSDLHTWIDHEIEELRKKFDHATDIEEVRSLQGSIKTLQRLKNIRDYATSILQKV